MRIHMDITNEQGAALLSSLVFYSKHGKLKEEAKELLYKLVDLGLVLEEDLDKLLNTFSLSAEKWDQFVEALDAPASKKPELQKLFQEKTILERQD